MDKDLKQFENRSDDWLAKERKDEDKVSAWDFDEGKKIKKFHEENCEAKEIKETHEKIHQGWTSNKNIPKKDDSGIVIVFILVIVAIVNIVGPMLIGEDPFTEILPTVAVVILIAILTKNNRRKK